MTNERLHPNANDTSLESTDSPADVDEVVYFEGSPALRGSFGRLLFCGLLGVGIVVSAVALRAQGWWVPLVGLVLAIVVVAIPAILIRSVRYRISNYRIDYERGVLSKDIDTLELWHVEDLKFHQSNAESDIVGWLQEARVAAAGVVINPAAFCYYSVAILDSLRMVECPVIEVHISHIHGRDPEWRSKTITAVACDAMISGAGVHGYALAIDHLARRLKTDPASAA